MSLEHSKFNHEQIEILINFVRTHKALYVNPRNIAKRALRAKLWDELGRSINKSPELCRKKFKDLRDRFVRNLKKSKPAKFRSHFKNLMFLLEIHPELQAKAERANTTSDEDDASDCSNPSSIDDYSRPNGDIDFVGVPSSATPSESNNGIRIPTSDIFTVREVEHGRSLRSPAATSSDILDKFLLGLGATIRTFPEMEVAKMKLELSTIVFNKEMELAANRTKKNDCTTVNCGCSCHSADPIP